MKVPDEAVEAAAEAHHNRRCLSGTCRAFGGHTREIKKFYRDIAAVGLEAAAPLIAAQALRDAVGEIQWELGALHYRHPPGNDDPAKLAKDRLRAVRGRLNARADALDSQPDRASCGCLHPKVAGCDHSDTLVQQDTDPARRVAGEEG